jgi:hypothetical protein
LWILEHRRRPDGDRWTQRLMLAIPQRLLRHVDLARHVPKWVGKMRRALAILAIQAA